MTEQSKLPPVGQKLLEYFRRLHRAYPWAHWGDKVRVCEEWRSMLNRPDVTQEEIDAVLDRLRDETNFGSAWFELGMHFRAWARECGFRTDI